MTLRVLCLDIEGGYGGSSRSLYESIRHLDRDQVSPEVWCGREGPIQARYADLNIPCKTVSWSRYSALPRLSRNLLAIWRAQLGMISSRAFLADLATTVERRFDVVHLNHESLFLVAAWLRSRTRKALVSHLRTLVVPSPFARWQGRTIGRVSDRAVFITENERDFWAGQGLAACPNDVIYNIVRPVRDDVAPHPDVPRDTRFKIACVSNYAWLRGLDRLVDVACNLRDRGRADILFVVAGDMRLKGSLPGDLGQIADRGGSLADFAESRGVASMFQFTGHVAEPERVLAACDAVARPSRNNDPWGRETLEALAANKPVIAIGTYDRFVETGTTGLLFRDYETAGFADAILSFADDRELCRSLGVNGGRRVTRMCAGEARAEDLLECWSAAAISSRNRADPSISR
jgi:glycosyltransferase involved in cell wall biosynthesis